MNLPTTGLVVYLADLLDPLHTWLVPCVIGMGLEHRVAWKGQPLELWPSDTSYLRRGDTKTRTVDRVQVRP